MHVIVLDRNGRRLAPCHPARARQLLKRRRAVVASRAPFTIKLIAEQDAPWRAP